MYPTVRRGRGGSPMAAAIRLTTGFLSLTRSPCPPILGRWLVAAITPLNELRAAVVEKRLIKAGV